MRVHHYTTYIVLPLQINDVFPFFCDVLNLERITPPELHFNILTPHPIEISKGTVVDYRLRLYGIPLRWRSEITVWNPPYEFVDQQVSGPYHTWIHSHCFRARNGSTIVEDTVTYRLPLWPLGEIAYPLVHHQLERIFQYRHNAIEQALLGTKQNATINR
jgi:ligand-binding SRPBCC domain-containing protein